MLYDVLVGNPYVVEFVTIASIIDKLEGQSEHHTAGNLGGRIFL